MNVNKFMHTIYLGDRKLKKIIIDTREKEVKFQIDFISRVRSKDGRWNFYIEEDVANGYIVFMGVKFFSMEPKGVIPNSEIHDWEVREMENQLFEVSLFMGAYKEDGDYEEVKAMLICNDICLEDVTKDGRIYE